MKGNSNNRKRFIVIGGGAAGFFAAVNAARLHPLLDVVILERTGKLLSKVKVSGGGRCNVTHACFDISQMIRKYPRGASFLKKAFHHFFTTDTIEWFRERGVELKTEADGRMFPVTDSSQTIMNCLLAESTKYKVDIRMNRDVKLLEKKGELFQITLSDGSVLEAEAVCVACGGFPKVSMFDWLQPMGHTIVEPVPSLFTFNLPGDNITELMGVSVTEASVKIVGTKMEETGPLLITHWGLSGPAVLRLSAWGARELSQQQWRFAIMVNWLPVFNENSLREQFQELRFSIAAQRIGQKNVFGLPARLWEFILHRSGINADLRWADLPAKDQNKLIKHLVSWEARVEGKTTFKEEFVTAGGIALNEVDPSTMMSKKVPGLFFAGEILDIDGVTGGFNFQNAWTTGMVVARNV